MPRRIARGTRRRIRRKTARLVGVRKLFEKNGIFIFEKDDNAIIAPLREMNILKKRVEALDSLIKEDEFARVLYNIVRFRGFKSNKKSGAQDKEDGKLLKAIKKNDEEMALLGYRTVGEYLLKEYAEAGKPIHNKGGQYAMCISRVSLEKEVRLLFEKQNKYGNPFATNENLEEFLFLFNKQRTFDEGPGEGSCYSGSHPIKKCIFYKEENCAAKGTYSNELSTAYQKINNLQLICDGERRPLTQEQREEIIEIAHKKDKVSYKDVRKILGLEGNEDVRFNLLNYSTRKKKKEASKDEENIFKCEDSKFISLSDSNKIRKILPDELKNDNDLIDEIAEICTKYKSESLFINAIKESKIINGRLDEETINRLSGIDLSGYGHLSLKALREINRFLKDGDNYSTACERAGHDHSRFVTTRTLYLGKNEEVRREIEEITSPVVKRAISQTIKVIDAIVRRYGSPLAVNIELAREMSQTKQERDETTRNIQERTNENQRIKEKLSTEFGASLNAMNMLKYKLYEEQNGKCIYSGLPIDIDRLFAEDKYCEVDHIIPYSRSFDDSFNNKVLVLSSENQNKRNATPFEYFERTGKDWNDFETRVKTTYKYRNPKKVELLLKKKFDEKGWKERALNDTRYASRMLSNLIKDYLLFDKNAKKLSVLTVNGRITAYLRHFWGIPKVRADGDKHHAVDASVIACVTSGMIQKLTKYNYAKEACRLPNGEYMTDDGEILSSEYYDKNHKLVLPYPYPAFCAELAARTLDDKDMMQIALRDIGMDEEYIASAKPFVVSRMSHRKAKGVMHEATICSAKHINDEESVIVKRTPLEKLTLRNGEIPGYFDPEGDKALYEAIKKRLEEYKGDGAKAFAQPLYKPCRTGQGNVVRKVKTTESYYGGGVYLDKISGIAANGSMIRVDLYSKDNKYYGVPVYTADLYRGVLPKRAATAKKKRDEWRVMDEGYTFEMSVYPNDLLKIESGKDIEMKIIKADKASNKGMTYSFTESLVYFNSFDTSTASINIEDATGCYFKHGLGIQGLKKITKCEIDVLGNVTEIKAKPKMPQPLALKKK